MVNERSALVLLLLFGLVFGVGVGTVGSTGSTNDFEISISNSIDVPSRTVSIEGDDFEVTAIARRFPGDSLKVDVTAPSSDTEYDVNLYNSDTEIDQSDAMTGNGTATFDTEELSPGLYYAAIYHDGNTLKIHPIVIAAYGVTLDSPSTAETNSTVSATVEVTNRVRTRPPNYVQVVVGDDERELRVNATEESSGTYTVDFTVDLPAGEYVAYGAARGNNETDNGEKEVVGISDAHGFTVTKDTPTPTSSTGDGGGSDDGGDGGGSDGGSADGDTTEATPTAELEPTAPATPTASPTSARKDFPSPTATSTGNAPATPTVTPTTTGGVITPRSPTLSPGPTTVGTTPGFGLLVVPIALWVVALLAARSI